MNFMIIIHEIVIKTKGELWLGWKSKRRRKIPAEKKKEYVVFIPCMRHNRTWRDIKFRRNRIGMVLELEVGRWFLAQSAMWGLAFVDGCDETLEFCGFCQILEWRNVGGPFASKSVAFAAFLLLPLPFSLHSCYPFLQNVYIYNRIQASMFLQ